MDKTTLCKNIGEFFGDFFEDSGKLCIDNGDHVFRYDTEDDLLADWVDTLVENHHDTADNCKSNSRSINDSWEKEIVFIYKYVIGKFPAGVRAVEGKKGTMWASSVDVMIHGETSAHGKNLHLGTYASIVDAIYARKDFLSYAKDGHSFDELTAKAKDISLAAKEESKRRKAPKCPHCGAAIY